MSWDWQPRQRGGKEGEAETRTLAAAAVLAAATATGGVLVTSSAKQQAVAAQQPAANIATVEKRTLSATVSQGGILTYRARSEGRRTR